MKKKNLPAPAPPPVSEFRLPRYRELTDVGLYLEQTVRLLNSYLAPLAEGELTASMVSNYVKHDLLPRPQKKLYYAHHLAMLAFISVAKTVAALDDIRLLLTAETEGYDLPRFYDYFCAAFEQSLAEAFGWPAPAWGDTPSSEAAASDAAGLLLRLVKTAADKVYLDHCLQDFREQAGKAAK